MDPAKLKVVELRQELASRGLDQKGVKAVLVTRLKEALDAENAGAPNSVSSESGESEPNNVEATSQEKEALAGSPIKNADQEDEEMTVDDEEENTSESISIKTTDAIENAPLVTSDPVKNTEDQQSFAEETKQQQSEQSEVQEEPMDVVEDANVNESTIADVATSKEDNLQEHVDESKEDNTASAETNDEPAEAKPLGESSALESEVGSEKPQVDADAKMESGDDDKTSVTQSEDIKRDGESDSDRKDRKRRRSRSKSSSPTVKRSRRASPVQNTDDFTNVEDEPEIDANAVLLSWFDSDLNLKVSSSDFLSARPISDGPLHMAWAGVRATHGVKSGKVSYEVLIDDLNRVRESSDRNVNEIRCGWSVKTASLQLGETPLSFGYGGSGKKSLNNEFTDYGCKFKNRGDVIGVYLDLESEPCKIEYTVNGESQGVAFEFEKSDLGDEALYPHILSKNTVFKVNFGEMEKPFVSKIKPKTERDDRRDSRRDRRSDRDSRRDRSRSRSRSRSRGERKEKSEDKEKSSSKTEKSSDDCEKPTNDDTVENTSKDAPDEPAATTETKVEENVVPDAVQNEENASDAAEVSATEVSAAEVPAAEVTADVTTDVTADVAAEAADANGEKTESQANDAEEELTVEKAMLPGYEFIGKLPSEQLVVGFSRPDSRKDCEVILLIGLPGSGKSYWAKNYVDENVEKRFNILGVQPLLSKMTISGEPRKKHVEVKWERFIDSCIRGVNIIQDIATKRRRNYIIDQTNVISQNQRRKIRGFGDFKRTAVVFIPDDEEYKQRLEKKLENEGKEVSEYSSDDMKANFSIPNSGCWFDEVQFVGLEGEEAKNKVAEYNEQGKKAVSSHPSSYNRGSRDYNRQRRDDRDNRDRRWGGGGGGGGGGDRRSDNRSDWRSQNWRGGSGGGGGFDRRDRWHGGGGGGGNWTNNYRGNNRYDDRGYRGGGGSGGYSRRDFGHDRDRRDDRSRNENRSDHRDFRDGNRDRRGEDRRRQDRGVPQREKDEKHLTKQQPSQNYKSTKTDPPTQGHWNPNVVGPHANNWNNYYQQQQNWGEYNPQQNWAQQQQWNQQQGQQPSNNYSTQQPHQDWSNWQQQQQQTQQPPPPPQQLQQDVPHGGWQNWAQHAQTYANAGDQPAPMSK